jgi:competence protein ComEA
MRADGSERLAAVFGDRPAGSGEAGVWPDLPGSAMRRPGAVPDVRPSLADVPTVPLPVVRPGGPDRASLVGRLGAMVRRFLPGDRLAARLDPGRPGATALALVAAAAASLAAVGVWAERPRAEPVDALPAVSAAGLSDGSDASGAPGAAGGPAASGAPTGSIVVSVVGTVRRPGLITLPDGSRVADAVTAAGGALPGVDLTGINLARRLGDGEQVPVGVAPPPDATVPGDPVPGGGAGGTGADGGPVDLNRASAAQLDGLPGVGPVTAERILEWRTRNGRFSRVEQLREVDGIGERRFAQLRNLVAVS